MIRCNTNTISRKGGPGRARSVDDIDVKEETEPEEKLVSNVSVDINPQMMEKLAEQHLQIIANKNLILTRKMTKTRSKTRFIRFYQY